MGAVAKADKYPPLRFQLGAVAKADQNEDDDDDIEDSDDNNK